MKVGIRARLDGVMMLSVKLSVKVSELQNLFIVEHHRHHPVRAQVVLLNNLSRTACRLW